MPGYGPHTKLAIYARDGFTPRLRAWADASGVILRTVADLFAPDGSVGRWEGERS